MCNISVKPIANEKHLEVHNSRLTAEVVVCMRMRVRLLGGAGLQD